MICSAGEVCHVYVVGDVYGMFRLFILVPPFRPYFVSFFLLFLSCISVLLRMHLLLSYTCYFSDMSALYNYKPQHAGDRLCRARDVYARPLSVFTGHVSHRRANGPYGSPLCVLTVSTGIQVPISFSSHALPAPFKLPTSLTEINDSIVADEITVTSRRKMLCRPRQRGSWCWR